MPNISLCTRGISPLALVLSLALEHGPASAQATPAAPQPAGALPAAGALPPTAEARPGEDTPDTIVVTGLKRDTRLIDVPVAVAVFDAIKIQNAGITTPTAFLTQTSNVNITTSVNPGDFFINIRGQSSIRGAEPAVAILIDGAKVGTPAEFNAALFDLEQIEVLKGPQGSYYGRNATAGAIILTTKKPTEEFSGSAFASYGNNQSYDSTLSVSGAIVPGALRARLSVDFKGTNGSYTNAVTGEHPQRYYEKTVRLRLTYDEGGPFTVDARLTGIFGRGGSDYFTAKIGTVPGLSPNGTLVHGYPITDIGLNHNLRVPYNTDVAGRYRRRIYSGAIKADYDFGPAVLSSITGVSNSFETYGGKNFPYSNASDSTTNYGGWTYIFGDKTQGDRTKNLQIQQELRLTSSGKHFIDYQAGFEFTYNKKFYSLVNNLDGALPASLAGNPALLAGYGGYSLNADGTYSRTLVGGGSLPLNQVDIFGLNSPYPTTNFQDDRYIGRNYAPYANVKVNFTDKLAVQLAARYDIEQREVSAVGPDLPNPFLGGASFNPCVRYIGETAAQCREGLHQTFRQLQPKATLSYSLNDRGSVYASWGKSFKSGGFNPIGTRAQTLQGITAQNIALGQSPADAQANAERTVITQDNYRKEVATTYEAGFKADLFDRRLYLNGAVFWTDIKNGQLYVFDPVVFVQSIQSIDKERVKGFEVDANFKLTRAIALFASYGYIDAKIRQLAARPDVVGNRPPYVAHDTLSVGAQVNQPIGGDKTVTARVEYNRTGETFYSIDNNPDFRRAPFGLLNGRLGLSTPRWDFDVFGRNLLQKRYVTEIVPIIAGVATATALAELRTFGAEFRVRF